ncbi:response regulator aspartate phosphatase B [Shouchella clausii]|nr:response regulator aspartate phosphatase B [Shouchella clausii]
MSAILSPEEVSTIIAEWYKCIIARSVDQANKLKEKAENMIKTMEPNDRVIAYYSLVEFRHSIMTNQVGKDEKDDERIQQAGNMIEGSIDHTLKYLYLFVSGQKEFMKERYQSAIRLFRKAERLLEYIKDEAEEAEFYYYMGSSLYRINQYPYAASYIEEALVAFNRLGYSERVVYCQVILGGIYSETGQHEKTQKLLEEALSTSNNYPMARVIVLRTLGLDALRKKAYLQAREYFEKSLTYPECTDTILGVKSEYNLTNTLFRIGLFNDALPHLTKAYAGAQSYNNHEYQARCIATYGLYVNSNPAEIDQAIKNLSESDMNFEIEEIAEEAATFFKQKGKQELAWKYLNVAYHARKNLSNIGVDEP